MQILKIKLQILLTLIIGYLLHTYISKNQGMEAIDATEIINAQTALTNKTNAINTNTSGNIYNKTSNIYDTSELQKLAKEKAKSIIDDKNDFKAYKDAIKNDPIAAKMFGMD